MYMNRQRWVLLVVFVAMMLAAWASAQETNDSYGERFYSREIWRLPPVRDFPALTPPTGRSGIPYHTPTALQVPHYEMLPAPEPEPVEREPGEQGESFHRPPSDLTIDAECVEPKPRPRKDKIWSGNFDIGMDGSEGNTETFNIHFGFHAQRKTDFNILTLGIDYNRQTSNTIANEERLYFDGRFEQLLGESRWSSFVHQTIEYDQFQPYNVRDTTDIGLGYRILDREKVTLIGRFGGGFMHEYGGPNNGEYVPEAVFGSQFEVQINSRQKFVGSVEYAPDVCELTHYRVRTQAAWEVLLDEDHNLNLRIGILDRYNNEPSDARKNDLDYAMMLMWKF